MGGDGRSIGDAICACDGIEMVVMVIVAKVKLPVVLIGVVVVMVVRVMVVVVVMVTLDRQDARGRTKQQDGWTD